MIFFSQSSSPFKGNGFSCMTRFKTYLNKEHTSTFLKNYYYHYLAVAFCFRPECPPKFIKLASTMLASRRVVINTHILCCSFLLEDLLTEMCWCWRTLLQDITLLRNHQSCTSYHFSPHTFPFWLCHLCTALQAKWNYWGDWCRLSFQDCGKDGTANTNMLILA